MQIHDFRKDQMEKVAMPAWLEDMLYLLGAAALGGVGGGSAGAAFDLLLGSREPYLATALTTLGGNLGVATSIIGSLRRALRRELAKENEKDETAEKDENASESTEKRRDTRSADKLEKSAMPLWLQDALTLLGAATLGGVGGGATGAVLDLLLGARAPILTLLLGGLGGGTGYATGFASALRREVRRALREAREKGKGKAERSNVDRSTSRKMDEDEDEEAEISLKGLADELKKYD